MVKESIDMIKETVSLWAYVDNFLRGANQFKLQFQYSRQDKILIFGVLVMIKIKIPGQEGHLRPLCPSADAHVEV